MYLYFNSNDLMRSYLLSDTEAKGCHNSQSILEAAAIESVKHILRYVWKYHKVKWWLRGASPYTEGALHCKGTSFYLITVP